MKFIFILLFLLPSLSFGQEPLKMASFITITVPDSISMDLYKLTATHLINNGYTISKSDKDLGIIGTERKEVKIGWELRVSCSIIGNKVKFTGKQFIPDLGDSERTIQNRGMKGSLFKMCFDEVNRLAKTFPHEEIVYSLK